MHATHLHRQPSFVIVVVSNSPMKTRTRVSLLHRTRHRIASSCWMVTVMCLSNSSYGITDAGVLPKQ
jgi:hypothetical protein